MSSTFNQSEQKRPLITVATVTMNDSERLARTIESVVSQTAADYEYVVIDGRSTDDTAEILRRYSPRISMIVSERDLGIYHAMNKAVRVATGEWIIFLNAGDRFAEDDTLRKYVAILKDTEVDFVYSDAILSWFSSTGEKWYLQTCSKPELRLIHQACIYRRNLHDEFGAYYVRSNIAISDYLFFAEIPDNRCAKATSDPICIYDVNNNISRGLSHSLQVMAGDLLLGRTGVLLFFLKLPLLPIRKAITWFARLGLNRPFLRAREFEASGANTE